MNRPVSLAVLASTLFAAGLAVLFHVDAQEKKKPDRETKVRSDKERIEAEGKWIYDDLPAGVAEAQKSRKPLLVVFRCIPCEACAKLDEDVVTRDPIVAALLDQFVCVRIPKANGMDLSLFQFDYDQSWAAFMLNADMTIYGRYGTRSSATDSTPDVSLEGFAKSLQGALDLHAKFPGELGRHPELPVLKLSLQKKRGGPLEAKTPEEFPSLAGKYSPALDYDKDKKIVPTCIHCHQVCESQRRYYRDAGKPIPEQLLFPYPNPRALGLVLDPKERARVASVVPGSAAEKAGFLAGDDILTILDMPILSIADVQWFLEHFTSSSIRMVVVGVSSRDGTTSKRQLAFPDGWRQKDDVSWRASSWDLRRMTTGGMKLDRLSAEDRAARGIQDGAMALVVKHVGQHGPHAAARQAGFRKDDVIVAVDGRTDVQTESQWLTWLVNAKKPGEKVAVSVLRDGKTVEMSLPMQ